MSRNVCGYVVLCGGVTGNLIIPIIIIIIIAIIIKRATKGEE